MKKALILLLCFLLGACSSGAGQQSAQGPGQQETPAGQNETDKGQENEDGQFEPFTLVDQDWIRIDVKSFELVDLQFGQKEYQIRLEIENKLEEHINPGIDNMCHVACVNMAVDQVDIGSTCRTDIAPKSTGELVIPVDYGWLREFGLDYTDLEIWIKAATENVDSEAQNYRCTESFHIYPQGKSAAKIFEPDPSCKVVFSNEYLDVVCLSNPDPRQLGSDEYITQMYLYFLNKTGKRMPIHISDATINGAVPVDLGFTGLVIETSRSIEPFFFRTGAEGFNTLEILIDVYEEEYSDDSIVFSDTIVVEH